MTIETLGFIGDGISFLGQVELMQTVNEVIRIFRLISLMLAVIGVVYSGYQFSQGNIASAGYGIIGAGIIGLSAVIVASIFDATDTDFSVLDF